MLRLKRSTAYELVRRGQIPWLRLGRFIRVPKDALPRMAEQAGRKQQAMGAAKDSRYYALLHLAPATGMRSGELLGLTQGDIDLAAGTVAVRRTLAGISGGAPVWQDPKTPAARRKIPQSKCCASTGSDRLRKD